MAIKILVLPVLNSSTMLSRSLFSMSPVMLVTLCPWRVSCRQMSSVTVQCSEYLSCRCGNDTEDLLRLHKADRMLPPRRIPDHSMANSSAFAGHELHMRLTPGFRAPAMMMTENMCRA